MFGLATAASSWMSRVTGAGLGLSMAGFYLADGWVARINCPNEWQHWCWTPLVSMLMLSALFGACGGTITGSLTGRSSPDELIVSTLELNRLEKRNLGDEWLEAIYPLQRASQCMDWTGQILS